VRKLNLKKIPVFYAALTLDGIDDQERNVTFVKTDFQALKFTFNAKQAFYPPHKFI